MEGAFSISHMYIHIKRRENGNALKEEGFLRWFIRRPRVPACAASLPLNSSQYSSPALPINHILFFYHHQNHCFCLLNSTEEEEINLTIFFCLFKIFPDSNIYTTQLWVIYNHLWTIWLKKVIVWQNLKKSVTNARVTKFVVSDSAKGEAKGENHTNIVAPTWNQD